jgi:hypothetical protein
MYDIRTYLIEFVNEPQTKGGNVKRPLHYMERAT